MNIDYLKTFLEVIKVGSFSEVAKKLSISQPAVSFQIHKLESELGIRLIDRTKKTIAITPAGRYLLAFAESVKAEWEHLQHDIDRLRAEVTGDLLIAASTIPGEFLVPPILARFKALHPAVSVQVAVSDSLTVISGLRNGTYEVGFCGVAPEGQELESVIVADDEIVLIVFPAHPFAKSEEVAVEELAEESLIFREQTSGTQRSLEALLSRAGINVSNWVPNMVLGTTQAVVSAVEAELGIAFVSNLAVRKSLALGLVRQIPVRGLRLIRDFYFVYRKGMAESRLLEEFISFVQSGAQHLAKGSET